MFNVSYKNKTTNVVVNDLNSAIDFAIGVSNNISGIKAVAITKDENAQTAEVIMYDENFKEEKIEIERNCDTQHDTGSRKQVFKGN